MMLFRNDLTGTGRNIEMDHSLAYIRIGYVVVNILLELSARLRRSLANS